MAFGDPMVLATLYNGGTGDTNHDSLIVDGPFDDGVTGTDWIWQISGATPAITSVAGARTAGAGSNFHRLTFTTPGTGNLGDYEQFVIPRYHLKESGGGHYGEEFTASMWIKRNDASAGTVTATLKIVEDSTETSNTPQALSTGTWYEMSVSRTMTSATVGKALTIRLLLHYGTGGGSPVIDVDEAKLYKSYTFAVNASMPDRPRLIQPGRSMQRSPGGNLIVHRSGAIDCNKYEYTLNFGLIGLAQLKSLRSLWLLDSPMRWTPNLPHLPTYLDVRFSGDFDLHLKSPSVSANNYYGSLTLVEI